MSSPDTTTTSPTATKSYDGNCHCGLVRYTVKMAPLESQKVMRCNCSICTKNGYYNATPPSPSDIVFHQGQDRLTSYSFGSRRAQHKFCPTCGSSVLVTYDIGKGEQTALNVRMFKGVEVEKLDFIDYDGWNKMQPEYSI